VPWIKGNGQRGFNEENLPKDAEKRQLYETGKQLLSQNGYHEIGMDHFALKSDSLYKAGETKKLHRNFMGYSASKTKLMIGLGVSSISDSWSGFAQNTKVLEDYYKLLESDQLPIVKGHILTNEDLIIRKHILNLTCELETSWSEKTLYFSELPDVLNDLKEIEKDKLIVIEEERIKITDAGRPFVRNICMAFDLHLKRKSPETNLFSMTV
jgi:oxygen-independent coproporphyrinogen-3 oxidase